MPKESDSALIVIDVQNDFVEGGALAVPHGQEVVPIINDLIASAQTIVLSQDWHCVGHSSFASQHQGYAPFQTIDLDYGEQTLWPDHCVAGTNGAAFVDGLLVDAAHMIVRKGYRKQIDSYSAFFENDQTTPTGLHGYLQNQNTGKLTLCGLATDYCVGFTALDAAKLGYDVRVFMPACRAIDLDGSHARMCEQMQNAGVILADA